MMKLVNHTQYTAAQHAVKDRDGKDFLFIAIKSAYDFNGNGSLSLSEQQIPITMVDEYVGEPGISSLKRPSDFSFNKTATDILLTGYAYPFNDNDRESYVYLKTNQLSYLVKVFGDRVWKKTVGGYAISDPLSFQKIPLIWERSFGGCDALLKGPDSLFYEMQNPVGSGFIIKKSSHPIENRALPNFESPGSPIKKIYETPVPCGFGAISPYWTSRAKFSGTCDDTWQETRMPLLPEDFDSQFFNVASQGLIYPGFMNADESITIVGLSKAGKMMVTLPDIIPQCVVKKMTTEEVWVPMKLDRVSIYTEKNKVVLLWSGNYEVEESFREIDQTQLTV